MALLALMGEQGSLAILTAFKPLRP